MTLNRTHMDFEYALTSSIEKFQSTLASPFEKEKESRFIDYIGRQIQQAKLEYNIVPPTI